jgi:hypothetical protein
MIAPDTATIIAYAAPWSPPTRGPVSAEVVSIARVSDEQALARYRGMLRGRIVLLGRAPGPPDVLPFERPLFRRLTEAELSQEAVTPPPPERDPQDVERMFANLAFGERRADFSPQKVCGRSSCRAATGRLEGSAAVHSWWTATHRSDTSHTRRPA